MRPGQQSCGSRKTSLSTGWSDEDTCRRRLHQPSRQVDMVTDDRVLFALVPAHDAAEGYSGGDTDARGDTDGLVTTRLSIRNVGRGVSLRASASASASSSGSASPQAFSGTAVPPGAARHPN